MITYAHRGRITVAVIDDTGMEREYAVLQLDEELAIKCKCDAMRAANKGTLEIFEEGMWRYAANGFEHGPLSPEAREAQCEIK